MIRKYFPLAAITTDIIVGYPTETEDAFENTLKFVRDVQFSDIHIFPFSPRPGTKAFGLTTIPSEVIKERKDKIRIIKEKGPCIIHRRSFIKNFVDVDKLED